jgi:hypothetical protein
MASKDSGAIGGAVGNAERKPPGGVRDITGNSPRTTRSR